MPLLNYTTKVNAQKTVTREPMRYPSYSTIISSLAG